MNEDIAATKKNIVLMQGDSGDWQGTVFDANGAAVDITTAKIVFIVKAKRQWVDSQATITKKNTAAGGDDTQINVIVGPPHGIYQLHVLPADTETIKAGSYWYYIQVELSEKTSTITYGSFIVVV